MQAAQDRLRNRVTNQMAVVKAYVEAEQQLDSAERRLLQLVAENDAKVAAAKEHIENIKRNRSESLATLAVLLNDDDETAALIAISVSEVHAAKRAVSEKRARQLAARAGRNRPTVTGNGTNSG